MNVYNIVSRIEEASTFAMRQTKMGESPMSLKIPEVFSINETCSCKNASGVNPIKWFIVFFPLIIHYFNLDQIKIFYDGKLRTYSYLSHRQTKKISLD
jgi:hypothetical protein